MICFDVTDSVLDIMELLKGADNTKKMWELVQQPGSIEVLMQSANTPQVLSQSKIIRQITINLNFKMGKYVNDKIGVALNTIVSCI